MQVHNDVYFMHQSFILPSLCQAQTCISVLWLFVVIWLILSLCVFLSVCEA